MVRIRRLPAQLPEHGAEPAPVALVVVQMEELASGRSDAPAGLSNLFPDVTARLRRVRKALAPSVVLGDGMVPELGSGARDGATVGTAPGAEDLGPPIGSAGTGAGNHPVAVASETVSRKPAQLVGGPWSYFNEVPHLCADEAARVIAGRTLGYVGVRFHKTGAVLCRECHQGMTQPGERRTVRAFETQGYVQVVYSCEQRRAQVDARCGVCGAPVIGEL